MDALQARKTWRTLEPVHAMIYFVPEASRRWAAHGLEGQMGYVASRAAAMGPVPAEVVIATFFNFNPRVVRDAIPEAWARVDPAQLVDARFEAADEALRRAWGDELGSDQLAEAAALARRAAEVGRTRLEGRPLFAAWAGVDWPGEPHLDLYHAQTLLRELRGDAHVAALLLAGVDPVEALVLHAGTSGPQLPGSVLRLTRAWSDDEWHDAVDRLVGRGLVEVLDGEPELTDAGATFREGIEELTDRASAFPYAALGDDGCDDLRRLARPFSRAIIDAGLLRLQPGPGPAADSDTAPDTAPDSEPDTAPDSEPVTDGGGPT